MKPLAVLAALMTFAVSSCEVRPAFAQQPAPGPALSGAVPPVVTFSNLPASGIPTGSVYQVSDVGVNGSQWEWNGTKWGLANGRTVLAQSGMPWVTLSSGSIAAGGAITGITALSLIYTKAWFYLPANSVSASNAAGWYYATCTTTTACTAFLNQPGSTFPVPWPASPTAVTAGQGSFTGQTGNAVVNLPTITVPANAMGLNGRLEAAVVAEPAGTSAVNPILFLGSDTVTMNGNLVGSTANTMLFTDQNRGTTGNQVATAITFGAASSPNFTKLNTTDTTASKTLGLSIQMLGSASAINGAIENFVFTLYNDGQ